MRIVPFIVASLAAFVACRSSGSSNTNPDSPSNSGAVTIEQIQNGTVPTGTQVEVDNVIVTAIDNFGGSTGNIWVEDPAGGEYSGVLVYKADPNVVSTLSVGDQVTITNALTSQFALTGSNADPTGRTDTELEPLASGQTVTVTKTGTGTVPAPVMVDALAIGMMSDADAQGPMFSAAWRKYLGVLITVQNVAALSAPKSFGSTTPTPADDYQFGITGVAEIEGSLADITSSGIARNTCLATVTGVLDYFYDYLLLPRQTADMVTGGTGCPAAETACSDGIDNDGNGYADCPTASTTGDDNCIITQTSCQDPSATIATLDAAADATPASPTLPYLGVSLANKCVTALYSSGYWLSNNATGAAGADGGIFVHGSSTGLTVNHTATTIGTATGYKAKSSTATEVELEINGLQATDAGGTCTATPAVGMTAATLAADATGHKYIGSLVTISATGGQITVGTAASTAGFGTFTQGSTTFSFGNTILTGTNKDTDAAGSCYTTVTGIWTYDTTGAGSYEILLTAKPTSVTCT